MKDKSLQTFQKPLSESRLKSSVQEALKSWHNTTSDEHILDRLYLYQIRQKEGVSSPREATNQIIEHALNVLAQEQAEAAKLLHLRYIDGRKMHQVATQLNLAQPTAFKKQRKAIEYLATTLSNMEMQARASHQAEVEERLPIGPQVELIGISESLHQVLDLLTKPGAPWIVAIEGLGGLGKTSLAEAVIRQPALSSQFANLAWISAKQEEFLPGIGISETNHPALEVETLTSVLLEQLGAKAFLNQSLPEQQVALTQILKNTPHLVVIDNLETVIDHQTILPTLRNLINPSKFLLTSRHSLRTHSDVYCLNIQELSEADTLQLVRHEAKERGLYLLQEATDEELRSIYEVVGGNPLAIKLVIGQISVLSLSQVLDNLQAASGKDVQGLFTYIYWQAWNMLDQAGQQLLLVMPMAQNNSVDELGELAQLEGYALSHAINQLASLSLIQIGGGLNDRRYSIHRLTESFLLNEAIRWQSLTVSDLGYS